ncbi:MAG: bifunctional precorrin-2 dehydrogenase/sirohydrochlorin ferrochelatase [Thermoplasmata archaeon]|uniref:precorrin-2 dehydrogenase n=1 Tax=Candidatus Sysuiplasma superficiale TaxID=2823368 RepID=A0A8J7YP21_9ARCH|nr:bifunctional precorrin-2 dehydrogenase/sirohydrochlorin ferrochelatase [Candidatus Sysuiplasma superficiale]MBX8644270.1 bifunctional precorrin-2 dehydrogenase/sirohydrochlorin ferrochelatase [Candidatus Sysuiplasma superficiale]MCL4346873.1 bifunctional precorrin-2 dehydrogenase/sirohydrochlorin ferrochelatase [Candidatus Thermoplasmatota archaeon]
MIEGPGVSAEEGRKKGIGSADDPHFPLMISLREKDIVIVGGGDVALHKAALLQPYSRSITVYSEEFTDGFESLDVKRIKVSGDDVLKLIGEPFLVICATDNHSLNDRIMKHCAANGILCNNVDVVDSDVYFASMIKGGPLTVSISTNGMSPTMSRFTKETIMNALNRAFWEMLDIQSELRKELRYGIPEMSRRKEILCSVVYDPEIWLLLEQGRKEEASKLAIRKVNSLAQGK